MITFTQVYTTIDRTLATIKCTLNVVWHWSIVYQYCLGLLHQHIARIALVNFRTSIRTRTMSKMTIRCNDDCDGVDNYLGVPSKLYFCPVILMHSIVLWQNDKYNFGNQCYYIWGTRNGSVFLCKCIRLNNVNGSPVIFGLQIIYTDLANINTQFIVTWYRDAIYFVAVCNDLRNDRNAKNIRVLLQNLLTALFRYQPKQSHGLGTATLLHVKQRDVITHLCTKSKGGLATIGGMD